MLRYVLTLVRLYTNAQRNETVSLNNVGARELAGSAAVTKGIESVIVVFSSLCKPLAAPTFFARVFTRARRPFSCIMGLFTTGFGPVWLATMATLFSEILLMISKVQEPVKPRT